MFTKVGQLLPEFLLAGQAIETAGSHLQVHVHEDTAEDERYQSAEHKEENRHGVSKGVVGIGVGVLDETQQLRCQGQTKVLDRRHGTVGSAQHLFGDNMGEDGPQRSSAHGVGETKPNHQNDRADRCPAVGIAQEENVCQHQQNRSGSEPPQCSSELVHQIAKEGGGENRDKVRDRNKHRCNLGTVEFVTRKLHDLTGNRVEGEHSNVKEEADEEEDPC
mmetsp:Transcript_48547/g.122181  ORF Transcript_48547/g.122181 Transcript_48547/m.122181 type:complete len:219 (+) Transcript_48547:230-886(+)